jgi:alkylation response protein AidB-like acyl-CoA dehydrogenase
VGIITTQAVPQADGSYAINGTKIFITFGDHDFTNNIIHLVLARLPGAPKGPKGISLFLVPKFLIDAQGNPGQRNGVVTAGIEKKMGIKGSPTCVLNFDDATGWLVGEPNAGLAAMFTMMNYARLDVAQQGLSQGERALQGAAAYTRERLQMRAATGAKHPEKSADPIIVHADIRRMLLTMKSLVEGPRALATSAITLSRQNGSAATTCSVSSSRSQRASSPKSAPKRPIGEFRASAVTVTSVSMAWSSTREMRASWPSTKAPTPFKPTTSCVARFSARWVRSPISSSCS